jgi:hypothetical protein
LIKSKKDQTNRRITVSEIMMKLYKNKKKHSLKYSLIYNQKTKSRKKKRMLAIFRDVSKVMGTENKRNEEIL